MYENRQRSERDELFVFRQREPSLEPVTCLGGMPLAMRLAGLAMTAEAHTSVIVRRAEDTEVVTVVMPPFAVNFEAVERALIEFALESTAGNRTRAAKLLRLTRSALIYRMHKYNLIEPLDGRTDF